MSTHAPQILIVEDENDIRRFVRLTLQAEGHEVHEAATLQRGLIEAGTRRPDLVVLDLGLPDGDGVDLIRDLRQWSAVPVIVLSARSAEASKIEALDAGADDYLVKPFGSGELMARVRAQLRRHRAQTPAGESVLRFGEVEIDLARHQVQRAGEPLRLTPIEYKLLTHLASQPERVVTHAQLLQAVWGPGHREDTHYVRVHMANLRKKIEQHPAMPRHLLTETGIGYRFVP
ncbi:MAG: two-component system response regulator KdpE [Comamonadaceae bacterium]|jgi:two-component system KDP operon response regulator KdpE|uniref:Two-component system response regulator KdpE n=1 Tax=Hydrogenophaga borbori TaxID=2294117 RepID=A0A372EF06_9BURK|nr:MULTISPECIES: two-component system response regulator KdpE [Hydrogenophaga]NCT99197.1 two-component system response regulator KdpE [Comamonadaceae bacterium]MBN9372508.1 two-component system response regulator KdpE [Hydrogenophaga sp.]OJV61442.1 MAG: DNA-binding response regulator [Hydrogenophaga sp. 70-12]RFP76981.1 two-component system response regulator KdpE [Hydrogenophaga borbori]WQB85215.1 two-component system response regulator KdpE [Hydrogenophaga sp. SNF1]